MQKKQKIERSGSFVRVSAIEVGTNSTKFIVAELVENDTYKVIHKTSINNRLSSGMYPEKYLSSEGIDKGIQILREYINESVSMGAKLLSVFSTSVLRDAKNKTAFIGAVKKEFGIDINVISGKHEAYLTHTACSGVMSSPKILFSSIDIGGGSTEFSIGDSCEIDTKVSLDIGAVRLTEMFVNNDPVLDTEIDRIRDYVDEKLGTAADLNIQGMALIGTGGTIKSLGTISLCTDYKDEEKVNGLVLSRQDVERLFKFLSKLGIEEKRILKGLNPKRADVIAAGAAILVAVMDRYNISEITISSRGVLEGFITDYLNSRKEGMYVTD